MPGLPQGNCTCVNSRKRRGQARGQGSAGPLHQSGHLALASGRAHDGALPALAPTIEELRNARTHARLCAEHRPDLEAHAHNFSPRRPACLGAHPPGKRGHAGKRHMVHVIRPCGPNTPARMHPSRQFTRRSMYERARGGGRPDETRMGGPTSRGRPARRSLVPTREVPLTPTSIIKMERGSGSRRVYSQPPKICDPAPWIE